MLLFVFGFAKKWMERDDGWEKNHAHINKGTTLNDEQITETSTSYNIRR